MEAPEDERRSLEIWIDGSCPVCLRSKAWCERRDRGSNLVFRDYRGVPEEKLPVPLLRHHQGLWIRESDGSLREGFLAWQTILLQIPRWRWLALASSLPPFRWLGPPIYRLIARYRPTQPAP